MYRAFVLIEAEVFNLTLLVLPFNTTIFFFVVRAEEFHGVIVASPSCTEYHWGTLIAFCWPHS